MARVYFLLRFQPEALHELIDRQLATSEGWLSAISQKETSHSIPGSFEHLTYHFRVSQIQSMVEWLRWLKNQLQ